MIDDLLRPTAKVELTLSEKRDRESKKRRMRSMSEIIRHLKK